MDYKNKSKAYLDEQRRARLMTLNKPSRSLYEEVMGDRHYSRLENPEEREKRCKQRTGAVVTSIVLMVLGTVFTVVVAWVLFVCAVLTKLVCGI